MENEEETPETAMFSEEEPTNMKAVMAAYLQQSANREQHNHITLKMDNFVESSEKKDFSVESEHVKVAGFDWYLAGMRGGDDCRFTLFTVPDTPCQFNIDIDYSVRFPNVDSSKEIRKGMLKLGDNCKNGRLVVHQVAFKDLVDSKKGFQMELDFTITNAKIEDLPEPEVNEAGGGNANENGQNDEEDN